MKPLTFSSSLPAGEVRAQLQYRAVHPKGLWDQYDEETLFCKFLPDGRFYLWKTGGLWQLRPQVPFLGQILPEGESACRITGRFTPMKSVKAVSGCFYALAGAVFLGEALRTNGLAMALFLLPFFLLWCGFGILLFAVAPRLFSRRQDAETLAFIENNLLR